jgi:hypothetical protein
VAARVVWQNIRLRAAPAAFIQTPEEHSAEPYGTQRQSHPFRHGCPWPPGAAVAARVVWQNVRLRAAPAASIQTPEEHSAGPYGTRRQSHPFRHSRGTIMAKCAKFDRSAQSLITAPASTPPEARTDPPYSPRDSTGSSRRA